MGRDEQNLSEKSTQTGLIRLQDLESHANAAARMAQGARRQIEIFTQDLESRIYDQQPFLEAVKHLAIHTKGLSVRVLLHHNGPVQQQGHRLVDLARRLPSSIQIRKTHPDFIEHSEIFMVVDRSCYIRKKLIERLLAEADFHDRFNAKRLSEFFDNVWDSSERDPELRGLYI